MNLSEVIISPSFPCWLFCAQLSSLAGCNFFFLIIMSAYQAYISPTLFVVRNGFVHKLTGWRRSWRRQSRGFSLPWLSLVLTEGQDVYSYITLIRKDFVLCWPQEKNWFLFITLFLKERKHLWNVGNGTFPISFLGFIILHLLLLQLSCTMSNNSWNTRDLIFTAKFSKANV